MKKITFLFALMSASLMGWAGSTQYCGETSSNANFTFSLMHVSGNTYRVQLDAIGADKFASVYNNNCGVNQSDGAGIYFGTASDWVITEDRAYIDFTTSKESSVPTGFYGNYFCFNKVGGGLIEISDFNPSDVDWTATCGAAEKTDPQLSLNETAVTLSAEAPAETFQIVPTRSGDGAITYESDKPGIASVSETGLVTAVGRGTATISVKVAETDTYAAATKKLTVTVTGPINWDGVSWLSGSNDKYKLVITPDFADTFGGKHVENGNLWVGFPSAAFGECSIPYEPSGAAWQVFALTNFPNINNQFTIECGGVLYTFDIYYVDGVQTPTAIDNVNADVKARKVVENGQLIIERDGVRYNVAGQIVK